MSININLTKLDMIYVRVTYFIHQTQIYTVKTLRLTLTYAPKSLVIQKLLAALFRILVPRKVQIQEIGHVKNNLRLTSSTFINNVDVDILNINTQNIQTIKNLGSLHYSNCH